MRPRSAHCGDDGAGRSHSRHGSGIRVLVGAALLLLAVCAAAVVPAAHAAHLQFGMRAAWSSTPLAFEASEFFTDAQQYFAFIQQLSQKLASSASYPSDHAQYNASLSVGGALLGSESTSLSVLRASLQLRSHSPAVETLRLMRVNRVARAVQEIPFDHEGAQELKDAREREWLECPALVAVGGSLHCGTEGLNWNVGVAPGEALEHEALYSFDHIFPGSAAEGKGTPVVLYADPLRSGFAAAHAAIVARLDKQPLRYALRPSQALSSSAAAAPAAPLSVQGFGVELAIKNMEYKVLDDSSIQMSADDAAHSADLPEDESGDGEGAVDAGAGPGKDETDVAGFNFATLKSRRPELRPQLDQLRDLLLREVEGETGTTGATPGEEKKPAVWELKDLGLQASQRILASSAPLEMLRDLSQNFPMYAQALTRTRLNSTARAAILRNLGPAQAQGHAHAGAGGALPPGGTNLLELNGLPVELGAHGEDLDYFSLLDLVKQESRSIDALASVGLSPRSVALLLQKGHMRPLAEAEAAAAAQGQQASSGHDSSPFLLHMGTDLPATQMILTYLNDIERDARYRPWAPSMQEYLAPSWPNQLKYVRRNAYTAIAVVDASSGKGLDFLTQARFFVNQNAPMRIGFVFWVPSQAALLARARAKAASKAKATGGKSAAAIAAAAAAAPQRGAWNSDLLSKVDGPWSELVGDDDSLADPSSEADETDPYSSPQARVAKVFYYFATRSNGGKKARDQEQALDFLQLLHDPNPTRSTPVSVAELEAAYKKGAKKAGLGKEAPELKDVLRRPELDERVQLCIEYAESRGLLDDSSPASSSGTDASSAGQGQAQGQGPMPYFVVNGRVHRSSPAKTFRDVLMGALMAEQHRTMYAVYRQEVGDQTKDLHAHWQGGAHVLPRVNGEVAQPVERMTFLPAMPPMDTKDGAASGLHYWRTSDAHPDAETDASSGVAALSYWLVADWASERGLDLVSDALDYVHKGQGQGQAQGKAGVAEFRVALVHNPAADATPSSLVLSRLAAGLTSTGTLTRPERFALLKQLVMVSRYFRADGHSKLRAALRLFVSSNAPALNHLAPLLDADTADVDTADAASLNLNLNPGLPTGFLASSGIAAGSSALVLNGRVISLESDAFRGGSILPDLRLLTHFTASNFDMGKLVAHVADPTLVEFEGAAAAAVAAASASGNDADAVARARADWMSEVVMRCSFVLLKRNIAASGGAGGSKVGGVGAGGGGATFPAGLDERNSGGMISLPSSSPLIVVRALVDPLSKAAQKLAPVLLALRAHFAPRVSVFVWLSPRTGLAEFPLKRFYRYALSPAAEPSFDESTGAVAGGSGSGSGSGGSLRPFSGASFRNLRTKHILSTVVFTPESWGIRLAGAKHDLDNLNVAEIAGEAVQHVQYELEHLLLFGQCVDSLRMEPPAGLQLMLGSTATPWVGDTVVMQNLGYFQLKAGPGEWTVAIADERHARIYEIQPEKSAAAPVAFTVAGAKRGTRQLFIRSFNEGFVRLDVLRKPGQERAQLLDPSTLAKKRAADRKAAGGAAAKKTEASGAVGAVGAMWNSVFGSGDSDKPVAGGTDGGALVAPQPRTGETIHIFSLASGHLYERFLKIMMLSVLGSTRHPVKFWFLANFASPQFREFVPRMARELGFQAEFVTYKWPVWLRRQEEKQRIIWGYKILFLDVLFPLAVPRVIYIDADQVVRGDVSELWGMDLQGAPYAYTPFCGPNANPDTEGFRFWKSGYWADHLRGRPYHISALYVVDLDVFRSMRAGDSLRGIYDNLSADPNSLANLDQDLPNYASHMVPIYSLPQEWLWCSAWCTMDSLAQAKTIDLCNNPLTKTPKLEVAKQLLPEWTGLDQRAKELETKFAAADRAAAEKTAQQGQQQQSPHVHAHSQRVHEDL